MKWSNSIQFIELPNPSRKNNNSEYCKISPTLEIIANEEGEKIEKKKKSEENTYRASETALSKAHFTTDIYALSAPCYMRPFSTCIFLASFKKSF